MQLKRWLKQTKNIFIDTVSYVGIFWLFVEMFSYSTNGKTDNLFKSITLFTIIFLIICIMAILKNKPKTSFEYQIRGKDNKIKIKVGDAFDNNGALIVPVNNQFDMSLNGNVSQVNSIQNQVIQKYYADKTEHINTDIKAQGITIGAPYEIGKTIEIKQKDKKFYLVVNSVKKTNGRVKSEIDDFIKTLNSLWQYIALDSGRNKNLTIPLISTQHGRDSNLSRKSAIKEIIASYIESSKQFNICDNLTISIHPSDLNQGNINLDEIDDYLKFSCRHYRQLTQQQKNKDPNDGSRIIGIDN